MTTHVWPKSRMLFAIVSKMSKENVVTDAERGTLKDLILEHDNRLLQCLQGYETEGNRARLYQSFIDIANQAMQQRQYGRQAGPEEGGKYNPRRSSAQPVEADASNQNRPTRPYSRRLGDNQEKDAFL